MEAIVTHGLTKVFSEFGKRRVESLKGVDLIIPEGEIFGFLGRNGAGKTTTIKILCGLIKATAGEAFLFGEPATKRKSRRLFGYLPEQPYFYEYLTPRETIAFYGRLQGLSKSQREAEWEKLSEMLDLRKIANQRIKEFSKGMRQRIGFAVALVGDPPLLILDEPMSGLDPLGRRMIRELIQSQRARKKTVFFSSHVLGDVEAICDRVGILVSGKLVRQGCIDELTGGHMAGVEVVARGLGAEDAARLGQGGQHERRADGTDAFVLGDAESANEAVRGIQAAGGALAEFNPLRQSLEEYFMREQEGGSS